MTDEAHESNAFKWDTKTISFIISIVVMIISLGVMWGTLTERIDGMERHIDDHGTLISRLEDHEEDASAESTDMKIRLTRIETDLAYIRAWIEKQEDTGGG